VNAGGKKVRQIEVPAGCSLDVDLYIIHGTFDLHVTAKTKGKPTASTELEKKGLNAANDRGEMERFLFKLPARDKENPTEYTITISNNASAWYGMSRYVTYSFTPRDALGTPVYEGQEVEVKPDVDGAEAADAPIDFFQGIVPEDPNQSETDAEPST
jgi:hypothetical protein